MHLCCINILKNESKSLERDSLKDAYHIFFPELRYLKVMNIVFSHYLFQKQVLYWNILKVVHWIRNRYSKNRSEIMEIVVCFK